MKKTFIFTILTVFTIAICSTTVAQAGTISLQSSDLLKQSEDFGEIKSLLKDMQQWITDTNLPETKLTEADLENGYKIYTDFKLEDCSDSSATSIRNTLKNHSYIWEIPVKISNKTYTFTIGKSQPLSENGKKNLTESEQKELKEQEGKFCIISFGEGNNLQALVKKQKTDYNYSDVYIVGGIPGQLDEYVLGVNKEGASFTTVTQDVNADKLLSSDNHKTIKPISWEDMLQKEQSALETLPIAQNMTSGSLGTHEPSSTFPTAAAFISALLLLGILGATLVHRQLH